uniref:Secreted protein n=1 Tax=Cutibacterium phage vB_CacS-HV1 TaxID=3236917 RepID=A0AB39CF18_9CAUD
MFTLPVPCRSILGPVLFVWGCSVDGGVVVFHPPLLCVRKITSPPSCVKKKKDTKEKRGGGWVFAFQGLSLGA